MAHFAKIRDVDNEVLEVLVVNNSDINNLPFPESEPVGIAYLQPWDTPGTYWKQTSYNANFRYNYAEIGGTYDVNADAFVDVKPYPSWLLNQQTYSWEAPVPYPTDGLDYTWDENTLSWVLET
jgi:hypothetical protein